MRYVILRDDDTNAFTPVQCLERLYRPFLESGLPVNLAVIPEVTTEAKMADGRLEGFLVHRNETTAPRMPIAANQSLVNYLRDNRGYRLVQHGCHHDYLEFDSVNRAEIVRRLERGAERLLEAGFSRPETFVAPYDKLSRVSLREVAARFRVLSTGWFELRRLPWSWRPKYVLKRFRHMCHWRMGQILLLSHPGCLLSYHRAYSTMLDSIVHELQTNQLTVLVTHWWEYFREQKPDDNFIGFLHETARYIAQNSELKALSFSDLLNGEFQLN